MQPIYFIPDANACSQQLLDDHGLAALVDDARTALQTFVGPAGMGIILSRDELLNDDLVYTPDRQRWSKRAGYTSMVGHWLDRPPTELELRRSQMVPGSTVQLLDGQQWQVPTLRKWRTDTIARWEPSLPRVLTQDCDSGRWALGDVLPQYSTIWQRSLRVAESMIGAGDLPLETVLDFAVDLLAINYRVDKALMAHLQLLTLESATEIVRSALDWATLEAQIKKEFGRRHGGTNTESGATPPTADSTTPIVQP